MHDDEIATKRLSDWKPETDIKLQKAFGKFVEEAGELQEAILPYVLVGNLEDTISFENEIADCLAFIEVIILASSNRMMLNPAGYTPLIIVGLERDNFTVREVPLILTHQLGRALKLIGRCQIQGLDGRDPESKITNRTLLENNLYNLKHVLNALITRCYLDGQRITNRKRAKIDSKLPWVMGTATDLLPST